MDHDSLARVFTRFRLYGPDGLNDQPCSIDAFGSASSLGRRVAGQGYGGPSHALFRIDREHQVRVWRIWIHDIGLRRVGIQGPLDPDLERGVNINVVRRDPAAGDLTCSPPPLVITTY
jgi:hypothetical protein